MFFSFSPFDWVKLVVVWFLCIIRRDKENRRRWCLNFNKMEFQKFLKITRICRNFFFFHVIIPHYLIFCLSYITNSPLTLTSVSTHNSWNHCEFCNFLRCSGNSEKTYFFIILEWYCIFLREHTQSIYSYEKFSNIYFVNHNSSLFQHTVQKRDIPVNKKSNILESCQNDDMKDN